MKKRSIDSSILSRKNLTTLWTGSRKTAFGFILIGVGIALDAHLARGLSDNMTHLLQFISIGFFLGNGAEHVANAIKERGPKESQDAPAISSIQKEIDGMKQTSAYITEQNKVVLEGMTAVHQAIHALLQRGK